MDNYDLLSITNEYEFLKNAIRWPSQGLFQAKGETITRVNGDISINCSKRLQIQ
jgi:hypothetical protein